MIHHDFFVMLTTQDGDYTPLLGSDTKMAKFHTQKDAEIAAKSSVLGYEFGYEVFERGEGK